MRNIRFRAKRIDNNQWCYGNYWEKPLRYGHEALIFIEDSTDDSEKHTGWTKVDRNTLGQFTGLFDKNGKEIYEGDILLKSTQLIRCSDGSVVPNSEHKDYYEVFWNDNNKYNRWAIKTIKTTRHNNFGLNSIATSFLYTYTDNCEISGNIHENNI
jgi:uncharacterized phage protein (TIGR01671 family)